MNRYYYNLGFHDFEEDTESLLGVLLAAELYDEAKEYGAGWVDATLEAYDRQQAKIWHDAPRPHIPTEDFSDPRD